MTSAICLDNLFHLSSFSLWHCCSTRMNISNTCKACKSQCQAERRLAGVFYSISTPCLFGSIYDRTWWYCTSLSSMETTTSFCVSSSLPASALFEPLNTNRSWTIGCRAGMAMGKESKYLITSDSIPMSVFNGSINRDQCPTSMLVLQLQQGWAFEVMCFVSLGI